MANDLHDLCFIMGTFICLLNKYFLSSYYDLIMMPLKENAEMTKKYSLLSKSVVKEKHNIYAIKYLILILKWADTVSIVFPQWKIRKFEHTGIQSNSNSLYCLSIFFFCYSSANICWIIEKAREFQENIYVCFIDYAKAFDCVDHNKLW